MPPGKFLRQQGERKWSRLPPFVGPLIALLLVGLTLWLVQSGFFTFTPHERSGYLRAQEHQAPFFGKGLSASAREKR
jgi:hypothetical protein